MYNNSTAMSEEGGLNIVYKDANTTSDDTYLKQPSPTKSEERRQFVRFFIRALHSFDSSTLQSKSDASICLSFEKNDIAFLHTIDESGWGSHFIRNFTNWMDSYELFFARCYIQ